MTVVLDTATLPCAERAAAFDATLNTTTLPVRTQRVAPDDAVYARVHFWQLGEGTDQVYTETSAFEFARTARHVRLAAPERISLAIHLRGPHVLNQGESSWTGTSSADRAELRLLDLTQPYSYATRGDAVAQSVSIDCERLGLPLNVVRRAIPRLVDSPLYELARHQFLHLPSAAAGVEGTTAAAMLGASTTELARALIASAAADDRYVRSALDESLLTCVDAFIDQNLRDPALDPSAVAAAHNISLRYLHRLFESRDLSVRQWIIHRRLECVRRELAGPEGRRRGVAATAHRWGFASAAHFAKRFKATYGLTPTEWQRMNGEL